MESLFAMMAGRESLAIRKNALVIAMETVYVKTESVFAIKAIMV
jgi:hypothetical protein